MGKPPEPNIEMPTGELGLFEVRRGVGPDVFCNGAYDYFMVTSNVNLCFRLDVFMGRAWLCLRSACCGASISNVHRSRNLGVDVDYAFCRSCHEDCPWPFDIPPFEDEDGLTERFLTEQLEAMLDPVHSSIMASWLIERCYVLLTEPEIIMAGQDTALLRME